MTGLWLHSHEEDTASTMVYRRADHAFPPARTRDAVELRSDGIYVEYDGGPDDRGSATEGRWQDMGGGRVQATITRSADRPTTRTMSVCSKGRLLVERGYRTTKNTGGAHEDST